MSDERINVDNPEAVGESSPYFDGRRLANQHEDDLQKMIRDRGRGFAMLFLVLVGSVYGNLYQLRLPKNIPYINNVTESGQVVTRILLKAEEVPPEDSRRQAWIKEHLDMWVKGAWIRSKDLVLMQRGINTALRLSADKARAKLSMQVHKEDLASGVNRETVMVNMTKTPAPMCAGCNSWQVEWEQVVTGASGMEIRRENWGGTFEVVSQDSWVTELNPYGIMFVNWEAALLRK